MKPSLARISRWPWQFRSRRQQVARVGDDFYFDPVAAAGCAGQAGQTHGFFGRARARRIGQQAQIFGDVGHNALSGRVGRIGGILAIHPAHGHGNDGSAAGGGHLRNKAVRPVLAGAR